MSNSFKRIAISSRSGCGNTTVTKLVSQLLNYKMVNYTFHTMADELGIEFEKFCLMAEMDSQYDYHVDDKQVELAMEGNSVLGSRLAIWMLKEADLKVFLTATPEVRAGRVLKREGGNLAEQMAKTSARDERDHLRYLNLYGIDNNDYSFADLIINADRMTPETIASVILAAAQ